MTNMSLRGKVTILIFFFIVTFAAFFLGLNGHVVWAGALLLLDFLTAFGVFELVTFLNKLAEENKKLEEENKDKDHVMLTHKQLMQLTKDGFIDINGERIEYGDRRTEED